MSARLKRESEYFQPREWEEQAPLEPEAYYQELREVFSRNLPRYFNGQERIGMSLTGGLDTRMIMAWQKPPPDRSRVTHLAARSATVGTSSLRGRWRVPAGSPTR